VPDSLRRGAQVNGYVFLGLSTKDQQFGVFRAADDPMLKVREEERRRDWESQRCHPANQGTNGDGAAHHEGNGAAGHTVDMESLARKYAGNLTADHVAELAQLLGLRPDVLARLPLLGFSPRGLHQGREGDFCWTVPEANPAGNITGIVCRYRDGHKPSFTGSGRALTLLHGWDTGEGPIFAVEGHSDTFAMAALNLAVVGRPSNVGGAEYMAELLKAVPADRDIIIVGEWDANKKGQWPGRDGAVKTAERLAERLRRSIKWTLPPHGAKDIRAWVIAQALPADCLDDWHAAGERLANVLREQAKDVKPAESALYEIDAEELLRKDSPDTLEYLPLLNKDGYFVRGWSHVIAGYPRCGKTELMVACIRQWLRLGLKVLYFTEESESLWWQRLSRRPGPWAGLQLVFGLGAKASDMLARMVAADQEVVVVDTLRNLGLLGEDENDNAHIAKAVSPWVSAARAGRKTWFGLHHSRKAGGEHGTAISGGHAIMGAVDVALEIGRDNNPRRRTIKGHARIIAVEELLYEQDEDDNLSALGSPSGVTIIEVRARLLQALGNTWLTTDELLELLADPKPSDELLRQALMAEAKGGRVERDPPLSAGRVRGKKIRWRASSES
jgi:hypothetical protein